MPPWPDRFVASGRDRAALLSLSAMYNTPPRTIWELAQRVGSARACVEAILDGEAVPAAERDRVRAASPEGIHALLEGCGARLIAPSDEEYPRSLEDLADPPAWLFVRGRALGDLFPRVAVVGARNSTPLGDEVARDIGAGLAGAGVTVVSGGARGIDSKSHEGALATEGPTIAVLGCGIDRAYPRTNRRLLDRVEKAGAVVSEYPPGVNPDPFRFPARNRIVAALAEAVVVVEGAAGSGSMITADHALDLGRPVYAVPGAVTNPLAEVPLGLIREGAGMIRGADDLLLDLGRLDPDAPPGQAPVGLNDRDRAALASLAGPTLAEQVARAMGCDLSEAVTALVGLELRGLVRSVGGRFERRLGSTR